MLKQVTVTMVVDDHEPEKCGIKCQYCGRQVCSPNTTNVKQLIPVPNTIGWGEEDGFTKEAK